MKRAAARVASAFSAGLMAGGWAASALAQEWVLQSPWPADDHLYNVHFHDAASGWIVGHDGIVMRTADGGATWAQSASFPRHWYQDAPVRNLQFVDALHGFAGGDQVYRTIDGGQTWVDMGYHGTAARMLFVSEQVGFILGNSGLRRTVDGGKTFETVAVAADVAFFGESTGVYVAPSGVFGTSDGGATWDAVSAQQLSRVLYVDAEVLIGVYNHNVLPGDHAFYRSADGGATWELVFADNTYPGSRYITDLELIDADSVAAVDVNGAIWTSDDAGLTWTKRQEQIGEFFSATVESWGLHFPTPSTGYAAGGPGVVLKSTDGGHSWAQVSRGGAFDLYDVEMHESGFGIAVGDDLGVLRTTDYGASWIVGRADTAAYSRFQSAQIIDGDTAVACGIGEAWDPADAPAIFYRSDDGGRTWEHRGDGILPHTAWSFEDVHFVDEDHGWLFGQTIEYPIIRAIFATTNGGLSWVRVDNGEIGFPQDGQMLDTVRGWFTSGGGLWITDDNWSSATVREYPVSYGNVNDFEFADASTGWLAGRWGEVLRTEDGGHTFLLQTLPGFDVSNDLVFDLRTLTAQEAIIASWHDDIDGSWGQLYRTTDGGEEWAPLERIGLAETDGGSLHVAGSLESRPDREYRLEFFANAACDPSGFGEGEEFLGSIVAAALTGIGTGAAPARAGGDERVLWRVRIDDYVPIQFVEVGPDATLYTAGGSGTYAIGPEGNVRWTSPEAFGGYPISFGADGTIYTAVGIVDDRYALVVALNDDGTTRWKFKSPNDARIDLIGPNVGPDGNIYAVQGDVDSGGLGAFALDPDGNLLWSNPGDPPIPALDGFTTVSDIVFGADRLHAGEVGLRSGGNPVIYTFGLGGEQIWTGWEFDVHTTSFPVVDRQNRVVCTWGQTGMRAISAEGEEEWFTLHPRGAQLVERPAVDDAGIIYSGDFISVDLWALNPDGTIRWLGAEEFPNTLHALGISPDGGVLVAQGHGGFGGIGWIRGYDPADGSLLWQVDLPEENGLPQITSSFEPAFSADGCVAYVTTHFAGSANDYGYLYAVRAQDCACRADFNDDGLADTQDVLAFLNAWAAGEPSADFNGDGAINTQDVLAFLNVWAAGC